MIASGRAHISRPVGAPEPDGDEGEPEAGEEGGAEFAAVGGGSVVASYVAEDVPYDALFSACSFATALRACVAFSGWYDWC